MLKRILLFSALLIIAAVSNASAQAVPAYKIGMVTPPLSSSEDEFRGAAAVSEKYPGRILHIALPENYQEEQETAITQILSLADNPEVRAIVICAGYSGILPAIQKAKARRPELIFITAPIWDDPDMMTKYVDLCLDTDWVQRGVSIPTKAKRMGAETFIHYSFPTHMAKEVLARRRDMMKETCDRLGIKFVELNTPDPKTGSGSSPMLQFLREDIPRQIAKYGKNTCVFGTNCPMQDVIIDRALELGFIMAEQCCPTPTQGFPAAMDLRIAPEDAGNFGKLNEQIKQKAAEAGCSGRLSTWPVPVGYFFPEFSVEVAREMIEKNSRIPAPSLLARKAKQVAGVEVTFRRMKPGLDNYYLILMDSIYY